MASFEGTSCIRYRPLDRSRNELRFLELRAPTTSDVHERITGRLVHGRLSEDANERGDFIGLSALVGDMTATEPIILDGCKVAVPTNVAQAMRHVRSVFLRPVPGPTAPDKPSTAAHLPAREATPPKTAPRWLRSLFRNIRQVFEDPTPGTSLRIWLDLLCINPRDAREHAERRSHMSRAYRQARLVVGWLGPRDATSDLAIDIIRAWDECMPASFGEPGDREAHPENYAPTLQWMGPVAHLSNIPEGITDPREVPSYKAVAGFLNRPYFRNTWMLEDMAMARFPAFLLGDDIVSWLQVLRLNRVNEDIKDHGADMFPDELRPLLEYIPLGSVYTFLREFDQRRRQEGQPTMTTPTGSLRSQASATGLPRHHASDRIP